MDDRAKYAINISGLKRHVKTVIYQLASAWEKEAGLVNSLRTMVLLQLFVVVVLCIFGGDGQLRLCRSIIKCKALRSGIVSTSQRRSNSRWTPWIGQHTQRFFNNCEKRHKIIISSHRIYGSIKSSVRKKKKESLPGVMIRHQLASGV